MGIYCSFREDVACGRIDVLFEITSNPWDFAAGALLVAEAGGRLMMPFEDGACLLRFFYPAYSAFCAFTIFCCLPKSRIITAVSAAEKSGSAP